tara:strand:- start:893 stop:1513 length:621 start_codon:yes stop_codon:yes gene_type:complete
MVLSVSLLVLTGCMEKHPAGSKEAGEVLFAACVPCHAADGSGKAHLGAPRIAGLQDWYVKEQLHKFRDGRRGAHPDDAPGLRMRPMARALSGPQDVDAVAAYVATLPKAKPAATLTGGDPAKGAAAYTVCVACHGAAGEGNELLGSPSLTGANDWYLKTQLHNFRSRIRGAADGDIRGAQMAPMAMTLADDQAILDVLAHIQSLGN